MVDYKKVERFAHFLLLKNNNIEISDLSEEYVKKKLSHLLCNKAFINYKNVLINFIKYCKLNKLNLTNRESIKKYISDNIDKKFWSVKYSRLIMTILSKYVLNDYNERPRFYEIKRNKFNIVSNRFDTQSYTTEQIIKMLDKLNEKNSNDDLFIAIAVMAGGGLRFEETRQFTINNLIDLFKGKTITMRSCKTKRIDELKLLKKYCCSEENLQLEQLSLNTGEFVGDVCLNKLLHGITVRNKFNKLITLCGEDQLIFKSFESYRSRFKSIKNKLLVKGSGINNNTRNVLRGSSFHALRRNFANELNNRIQDQPNNVRLSVVAQGLRHTNTTSTQIYLQPNVDNINNIYEEIMS